MGRAWESSCVTSRSATATRSSRRSLNCDSTNGVRACSLQPVMSCLVAAFIPLQLGNTHQPGFRAPKSFLRHTGRKQVAQLLSCQLSTDSERLALTPHHIECTSLTPRYN